MGLSFSRSRRRLILSAIMGVLVIGGAYVFTLPSNQASATGTDDLLKTVASQDSNHDGMPDWEEVIYGLDPKNPHSFSPTLTNAEAIQQGLVSLAAPKTAEPQTSSATSSLDTNTAPVASSLTDQFARNFFTKYMSANGGQPPSDNDKEKLVADFVSAFKDGAGQILTSRYTLASLKIDNSIDASGYAAGVENTFHRPGSGLTGIDLTTLIQNAVQNNDPQAQENLRILADEFGGLAVDLAKVPAPQELADAHLQLVQSFDLISLAEGSISHVSDDPLVAMAGLRVLAGIPKTSHDAFEAIVDAVTREKGTPDTQDKPGFILRAILTSDNSSASAPETAP